MSPAPQIPHQTRLVLVTGPSGAGRSTAINALEDLGFEAIDNLPLSLVARLLDGTAGAPPHDRPLALGIDVRNRDFSTDATAALIDMLARTPEIDADVLYLDARPEVLRRRYSETRRRHPLAPSDSPEDGIAREIELLAPIRDRAAVLIETSELTPHDLRAEIAAVFGGEDGAELALSVQSFSYKRGLPRGVDMVFDMRFLRNPHWQADLRHRDGRDDDVTAYVAADPRYAPVFERIAGLVLDLLPAFKEEGKTHLAIGFGCTGGRHRSVTVAEHLARTLAKNGWRVSTRHRELERHAALGGRATGGKEG